MPHTIRLAGPWQMTVGDNESQAVRIPAEIPAEAVTLERTFNRPANLGEDTKLFLCFNDCGRQRVVVVDGTPLNELTSADLRLDISAVLSKSPRVRVEVSSGDKTAFQPARLEIVEPWDEWDDEAA